MLTRTQYKDATLASQAILRQESPGLLVDGKWGDFTQSVYDKVSPSLKNRVDSTIKVLAAGSSTKDLYAFRQSEKRAVSPSVAKSMERAGGVAGSDDANGRIKAAVRAAAQEFGLDEDMLMGFVKIESNFNPKAQNGRSRGLMQMQPGAWSDAKKFVTGEPLPSYEAGVWDPVTNARAGAAYIKYNASVLKRLGYSGPWDAPHMYLAHQQGAGGLMNLWAAANGRGGKMTVENMKRNPPQDGLGVTTNPSEFYKRWVSVAQNKMNG